MCLAKRIPLLIFSVICLVFTIFHLSNINNDRYSEQGDILGKIIYSVADTTKVYKNDVDAIIIYKDSVPYFIDRKSVIKYRCWYIKSDASYRNNYISYLQSSHKNSPDYEFVSTYYDDNYRDFSKQEFNNIKIGQNCHFVWTEETSTILDAIISILLCVLFAISTIFLFIYTLIGIIDKLSD